MTKDNFIAFRITDEEKAEIEETRKQLKFNTLSEFIFFLWQKFKSERIKEEIK